MVEIKVLMRAMFTDFESGGRDHSNWIKARIKQAGFIENQDFWLIQNSTIGLQNWQAKQGLFLHDKPGEQKKHEAGIIVLIISFPDMAKSTFA